MGVNHAGTREGGVSPDPRDDDAPDYGYHTMTMPEVRRWMAFLSARLRHVRILNGDWRRALTSGASKTISVRMGGYAGIFLDPPYDLGERAGDLYTHDVAGVAKDVLAWCVENGPDPKMRIVLAGYDVEHCALEALGWRSVEWYRSGFLKGGMANQSGDGNQQGRERLWMSPACLGAEPAKPVAQTSMFGGAF